VAIGEALRLIRVLHDKKSRELAEEVGISASYLSEIENGHKRPSLEIITKYAEVFDVRPSVILFFSEGLDEDSEARKYSGIRAKLLLFMSSVARCTGLGEDDNGVSDLK